MLKCFVSEASALAVRSGCAILFVLLALVGCKAIKYMVGYNNIQDCKSFLLR